MTSKKSYSRFFIILQEDEKGHALERDKAPSGYAKLEIKNNKCKLSYYIQNLKSTSSPYYMALICNKKDTKNIIKVGKLNIDNYGRADITYEYDSESIANTGISCDKIVGAAIISLDGGKPRCIMNGFITSDIPEKWINFAMVSEDTIRSVDKEVKENIFDEYEKEIEDTISKNHDFDYKDKVREEKEAVQEDIKESVDNTKIEDYKNIEEVRAEITNENIEEIIKENVDENIDVDYKLDIDDLEANKNKDILRTTIEDNFEEKMEFEKSSSQEEFIEKEIEDNINNRNIYEDSFNSDFIQGNIDEYIRELEEQDRKSKKKSYKNKEKECKKELEDKYEDKMEFEKEEDGKMPSYKDINCNKNNYINDYKDSPINIPNLSSISNVYQGLTMENNLYTNMVKTMNMLHMITMGNVSKIIKMHNKMTVNVDDIMCMDIMKMIHVMNMMHMMETLGLDEESKAENMIKVMEMLKMNKDHKEKMMKLIPISEDIKNKLNDKSCEEETEIYMTRRMVENMDNEELERGKHKKDKYKCGKNNKEKFFEEIVEDFEKMEGYNDIKNCKWYKVEVDKLDDMYCMEDHKKYTIIYYPMICYHSYISKYKHFMIGYKYNKDKELKYIVYAVPGRKCSCDQPYGGKTGFVTWMPHRDHCDYGYWLMFYDFKNSTVVVPVKK